MKLSVIFFNTLVLLMILLSEPSVVAKNAKHDQTSSSNNTASLLDMEYLVEDGIKKLITSIGKKYNKIWGQWYELGTSETSIPLYSSSLLQDSLPVGKYSMFLWDPESSNICMQPQTVHRIMNMNYSGTRKNKILSKGKLECGNSLKLGNGILSAYGFKTVDNIDSNKMTVTSSKHTKSYVVLIELFD